MCININNQINFLFFRNLDNNGSININEFSLEKDYVNEGMRPFEDHLILKDYYKEFSDQTELINFNLVVSLLENLIDSKKEGKKIQQI
jgi:hypothetical protein